MDDEHLARIIVDRLEDFSPAVNIRAGDHGDQVVVEIVLSRTAVHISRENAARRYRVVADRSRFGSSDMHLVHVDGESSLCGIPLPSLTQAPVSEPNVCDACLKWLEKRRAASRHATRMYSVLEMARDRRDGDDPSLVDQG